MSKAPVVLRQVRKSFRRGAPWNRTERTALGEATYSFAEARAYALRGMNGSGKSTLLRLVAGLLSPDDGSVEVLGRRPDRDHRVRAHIGFASGDERSLLLRLTGRHNLEFFAAQHDLRGRAANERIGRLADELDLNDFLDERVDHCSAGMKARIGLARALLHEPRIVLLDEPTKSLDEDHARAVRASMSCRVEQGMLLIAATHSDEEAVALGAHCLRLERGALVELGDREAAE